MLKQEPNLVGFAARPFAYRKESRLKQIATEEVFFPQTFSEPISNLFKGGSMKIKFTRSEETQTKPNASGKTFNITKVFGTALDGKNPGQEWSTQFFTHNKELAGQVAACNAGDTVEVKMTKNGAYWNPSAFTVEAPATNAPVQAANSTTVMAGNCGGHASNPRFDNLKVAIDILGEKPADKEAFEYLSEAAGLADMIQDYIEKTGAFQFDANTSDGIPEIGDDDESSY